MPLSPGARTTGCGMPMPPAPPATALRLLPNNIVRDGTRGERGETKKARRSFLFFHATNKMTTRN